MQFNWNFCVFGFRGYVCAAACARYVHLNTFYLKQFENCGIAELRKSFRMFRTAMVEVSWSSTCAHTRMRWNASYPASSKYEDLNY